MKKTTKLTKNKHSMKKMKQLFLKKCNAILVVLLGVFGFSACDNSEGKMMYGTPQTDFVLKGTVVDKIENRPIEDIQVKFIERLFVDANGKEHILLYRATSTNEDGSFKLQGSFIFSPENSKVRFIDENGVFAEKTKELDWEDAEQTRPGSGWFRGEFTKALDTVQLTKRTDEDYDDEDGNETDE